jgi:CRISPR-associated endonuclease/helicase Cas3/CRISPR-associated protein Cas5t
MRRPVWPLRLGRSQDLATARTRRVGLQERPGQQHQALLPAEATTAGTLLQLPTAVSLDRSRTRWDAYRYHPTGSDTAIEQGWATENGDAVLLLPPVHPHQLAAATAS